MAAESAKTVSTEFTNPNLEVLYSESQIRDRVAELGREITERYAGRELVLVSVLKGSCVFLADLMRAIDLRLTIDFMSVSSYKDGTKSTGDVDVVEDIIDTGLTLSRLLEILSSRGANSIALASFLDKPEPRIKKELKIDFTGFVVPNRFVVGYGLDAAGRYRNLPFIAVVKDPGQV